MTQVKFGRHLHEKPPFEINDLTFSGLPLSLAEERRLATSGEGETEADLMNAVLDALAEVLNARAQGRHVDAGWLTENLAPADVEGILDYLRTGTAS
ncbi:hypothetical protein [Deinococcus arcticus]|uniref:Uncharacterized protein n=1 Tax=Deinococcus arcticus TaxID=2136176 RepID=A0A2T3W8Z1_9DEIO|nr:hypothetical protein [Deinococcus arcticus]PTA68368.1 hypothetical protein C8263_07970 [Deinococcus arcticus]